MGKHIPLWVQFSGAFFYPCMDSLSIVRYTPVYSCSVPVYSFSQPLPTQDLAHCTVR